jgi:hypothetical protein
VEWWQADFERHIYFRVRLRDAGSAHWEVEMCLVQRSGMVIRFDHSSTVQRSFTFMVILRLRAGFVNVPVDDILRFAMKVRRLHSESNFAYWEDSILLV